MNSYPKLSLSGRQPSIPTLDEMRVWWRAGKLKYDPTPAQIPILTTPHRFILVAGGERGGKSITAAAFIISRTLDLSLRARETGQALVWLIGNDYESARAEWEYLRDDYTEMGLVEAISDPNTRYAPRSMRLRTGIEIKTLTAADEVKIASFAPDIVVMCEAAQMSHNVWLRSRGRVAQKRGIVILEGTFEDGEPWYDELYTAWQGGDAHGHISFSLPSWSNTHVYPGGYDDPEMAALRAVMSADRFMARHGGVPVPPSDIVFPEFNHGLHVGEYPFNPRLNVELAIDPGWAGAYAVLALQYPHCAEHEEDVHVIDEVYVQKTQAHHVIDMVLDRPWARNIIPRQAGVIDIAGNQHHGDRSQVEIWQSRGFGLASVPVGIADGIERYRTFLVDPATSKSRVFYNGHTTQNTIKEHRLYRYKKREDGKPVREVPIDAHNHGIKALTYALVRRYGFTGARRSGRRKARFNYGTVEHTDGPFGPYPGKSSPRLRQPYADRWLARHATWQGRRSRAPADQYPRLRTTRGFRVRRTR